MAETLFGAPSPEAVSLLQGLIRLLVRNHLNENLLLPLLALYMTIAQDTKIPDPENHSSDTAATTRNPATYQPEISSQLAKG